MSPAVVDAATSATDDDYALTSRLTEAALTSRLSALSALSCATVHQPTTSKVKILALFDWCLKRSRLSTAASSQGSTGTDTAAIGASLAEGAGRHRRAAIGSSGAPAAAAAVATEALLVPGAAVAVVAAAAAAAAASAGAIGGPVDQLHWSELVWETVGQPRSPSHLRATRAASATLPGQQYQHHYQHEQDYVSGWLGASLW